MLKDASIALAASTDILTSVARTKRSLSALDAALSNFKGSHHLLQVDWSNQSLFLDALATHITQVGIPSLVVAWLHDDLLGPPIARLCSSQQTQCSFFQVRGSDASSSHSNAEHFARQFETLPGLRFHQVILGFMRTGSGSRWLRNAEISEGVLRATVSGRPLSIVGSVEPWNERP